MALELAAVHSQRRGSGGATPPNQQSSNGSRAAAAPEQNRPYSVPSHASDADVQVGLAGGRMRRSPSLSPSCVDVLQRTLPLSFSLFRPLSIHLSYCRHRHHIEYIYIYIINIYVWYLRICMHACTRQLSHRRRGSTSHSRRRPTHEMHVHECHRGSGLGTSTVRRPPNAKQSMPTKAFREGAIRKTMVNSQ